MTTKKRKTIKLPPKTARARAFMESNPAAAPNEVAARFGLKKQSVYVLRNDMKKKGFVFPPRSQQLATLAPAESVLTEQQQMIAKKLNLDPLEYAQAVEGLNMMRDQLGDKAPKRFILTREEVEYANNLGISLDKFGEELEKMRAAKDSQELELTGIEMYEDTVDVTLDARALDYGKFIEGAEVMQMLKRVVQNALSNRDKVLAHDQAESMDMIIHKIGRIVNGNPDVVDHWLDIAGYAKLVADRLEGRVR